MSNAIAGHGAKIQMELDPTGSPGVFTDIAELNGDIQKPELSRNFEESTPHNATIDYHVGGVLRRSPLTGSCNFIFDNNTHDHATGLRKAIIDDQTRGFRILGPTSGAGTDTDEWICSGNVMSVTEVNPVRDGIRTSDFSIQLSGPMKIDGVTVGT
jgi:hypothetical protein